MSQEPKGGSDIAIVGMAAHLPDARTPEEFWSNIARGVESVRSFTDAELLEVGVLPGQLANPNYVKAGVVLQDLDGFDAEFFGFSPKEAAIMDPQHRHFLECAWEALEDAGHMPESFPGSIGVFGGCGMGAYFAFNLLGNPELVDSVGLFLLRHTGNDKDFLTTRVSYNLDLRGPSVSVQTACSTSLVATHLACQSLLSGECDLALAGGVTIEIPHARGYVYQAGEILSPDGHCRAFDHRSQGTIFGSGAGVVVLRRLEDALSAGDHIYAVIKGSAVNNDGAGKVGYLAPSVDGQAAAIAEALSVAGVHPDTLGYVECHGTGTPMGDPIEIAALTQAFRRSTSRTGFCAVGSVKTNIGHLDTAAGVASLIKTSLALTNQKIPPSLHFEAPNPHIDFAASPFYVSHQLVDWKQGATRRRAAVNSLGVGGTNAHVILEEAPLPDQPALSTRACHLLVLSARSRSALDAASQRLAAHLSGHPEQDLADVAYTLETGRRVFAHRRVLAAGPGEAPLLLAQNDPRRVFTHTAAAKAPPLVFLFPGGGAQYPGMGLGLEATEPVFREWVSRGLDIAQRKLGRDLRPVLFATGKAADDATREMERPSVQLPAIFVIEYALAQLWMSYGVRPAALVGHSMGENTAACLASVLSFEDAIGLVVLRGQLMDEVPEGGMLSVSLAASELLPLLGADLDLASVNSPALSVASGPRGALEVLEKQLAARGIEAKWVRIQIAAHSRMLEPILGRYEAYLRSIALAAPKIPIVSNLTGTWLSAGQATDPSYWVRHLRSTVRFADCVATLQEEPGRAFLEVGPGKTLSSLVRQHPQTTPAQTVLSTLRHPEESVTDAAFFLTVFGRLWASGVEVSRKRARGAEKRRRVSLPAYPFQRQRFFIEPTALAEQVSKKTDVLTKMVNVDDWFYRPIWKPVEAIAAPSAVGTTWLVFMDDAGIGQRLVSLLESRGDSVVVVRPSDAYYQLSHSEYRLSPEHGRDGYDALVRDLVASGKVPDRVVHLWLIAAHEEYRRGSSFFHQNQERGFYSLLFLAQALGELSSRRPMHITVVSSGMQQVESEGLRYPDQATVLGPCKVMPRELEGVTCASVDLLLPAAKRAWFFETARPNVDRLVAELGTELLAEPKNRVVAWREGQRYEQAYEKVRFESEGQRLPLGVREGGTYLITGGLGGIGLTIAKHLASAAEVKLVLVSRSPMIDRPNWDAWLSSHGDSDSMSTKIASVRELERLGAEVLVLAADVTDKERMRQGLLSARQRFGELHGVFHAAGVLADGLIQTKTQASIEGVFAPKVYGTLVLDSLLGDQPLDFLLLFSSTSTATGPVGQVDYVAANAFLNAYAESRRDMRATRTVAINWGVWNEVGMAAELTRRDTDDSPGGAANATVEPVRHPLFRSRIKQDELQMLVGNYGPAGQWILDEHRTLDGHAVVPGTAYLEMASAALGELGEQGPFEVRDLFFLRPLGVDDDRVKVVRAKLIPNEQGYDFEVQSREESASGRVGWELHAQGKLVLGALSERGRVDLAVIEARCNVRAERDVGGIASRQERHLRFGPRWRVLKNVKYGATEALGRLELPAAFHADLEHYVLHPALLDIGTGFAMDLIEGYGGEALWVPVSYRRVRVFAPLPPRVVSWVKRSAQSGASASGFASFDVVLADESGQVLVEVDELTLRQLSGVTEFTALPPPALADLELEPTQDGRERPLSPAERAFVEQREQGILPPEGCDALDRLLQKTSDPVIVVSSLDLLGLLAQADRTPARHDRHPDGVGKFARPELSTPHVAPRDDIERTLVGFWEELLGVEKVGVEDNFFDLGGHSLVAVRLFAKIKKSYRVDYPISVLFEAPTIARCAALLQSSARSEDVAERESLDPHRTRLTHLVSMHPPLTKAAEKRAPFFLVAGMFGNVLNLRHLAHLIGRERRFYGLQARGLYGDHTPHETFEAMAADYIVELRTVQPHGPYLLGGFSGGGITAFEIARQLMNDGERVAMLVLLDTPLPSSPSLTRRDRWMLHLHRFRHRGAAHLVDWVKDRYTWEAETRRPKPGDAVAKKPFDFHSETIEAAFRRALDSYHLRPLPLAVNLFRPRLDEHAVLGPGRVINRDRRFVYHDNGWSPYVERVEVFEMPGDHDSMVLEPNVRVLAARLRECMERVESQRPPRRETTAPTIPERTGGSAPTPELPALAP